MIVVGEVEGLFNVSTEYKYAREIARSEMQMDLNIQFD